MLLNSENINYKIRKQKELCSMVYVLLTMANIILNVSHSFLINIIFCNLYSCAFITHLYWGDHGAFCELKGWIENNNFSILYDYRIVTNPIDVTKVRLQLDNELVTSRCAYTGSSRYYNGFLQGGLRIYKEEGIRGFYKGWVIIGWFTQYQYKIIPLEFNEDFPPHLTRQYAATTTCNRLFASLWYCNILHSPLLHAGCSRGSAACYFPLFSIYSVYLMPDDFTCQRRRSSRFFSVLPVTTSILTPDNCSCHWRKVQ